MSFQGFSCTINWQVHWLEKNVLGRGDGKI